MADILTNISSTREELEKIQRKLMAINTKIGYLECAEILQKIIRNNQINELIKSTKETLAKFGIADTPLISLEIKNKKYKIILAHMENYVSGEYIDINDLVFLIDSETMRNINSAMDMFEDILIINSKQVYEDTRSALKLSHKGINSLLKSKRKQYLYYYSAKKNNSIGFICVPDE